MRGGGARRHSDSRLDESGIKISNLEQRAETTMFPAYRISLLVHRISNVSFFLFIFSLFRARCKRRKKYLNTKSLSLLFDKKTQCGYKRRKKYLKYFCVVCTGPQCICVAGVCVILCMCLSYPVRLNGIALSTHYDVQAGSYL